MRHLFAGAHRERGGLGKRGVVSGSRVVARSQQEKSLDVRPHVAGNGICVSCAGSRMNCVPISPFTSRFFFFRFSVGRCLALTGPIKQTSKKNVGACSRRCAMPLLNLPLFSYILGYLFIYLLVCFTEVDSLLFENKQHVPFAVEPGSENSKKNLTIHSLNIGSGHRRPMAAHLSFQ